jgi:8-oxo-dGTP pyrophosphatase MutT (NUDIX family)
MWESHVIGSVEPDYLSQIDLPRSPTLPAVLQPEQSSESLQWRVRGDLTLALAQIAQALLQARVGSVVQQWRNEQLAVCDAQGQQLATVERGVVRPLGVATRAVHLVGRTSDGRFWLQQRALNKANDPGLWDTLMGGMVSARDTVQTALERETWEEAGLRLTALEQVRWGGRVDLCKPCSDDAFGYVVEQTDWYDCTVPQGVQPVNQDGEVEQFLLLNKRELMAKLQRDEFTTEAALILVAALHLP